MDRPDPKQVAALWAYVRQCGRMEAERIQRHKMAIKAREQIAWIVADETMTAIEAINQVKKELAQRGL